jgi:hypothetical protein
MIFFDLDGVLRDLCGAADINPTDWNCIIKGKSFTQYFTYNKNLLHLAKPTEYLEVAKVFSKFTKQVHILTHQPKDWQRIAVLWIQEHFEAYEPPVTFTEDKLSLLEKGDILIDDNPGLSNYDQVLLIHQPYNVNLTLPHLRIYTSRQLFREIAWRIHV